VKVTVVPQVIPAEIVSHFGPQLPFYLFRISFLHTMCYFGDAVTFVAVHESVDVIGIKPVILFRVLYMSCVGSLILVAISSSFGSKKFPSAI